MVEELDALGAKLGELNARLRLLREENVHLRAQLSSANAELDAMRNRVASAMQRIDALLERLPEPATPAENRR